MDQAEGLRRLQRPPTKVITVASGKEHCLRPDLTTPIAQMVASNELPVARYYESGPVYRLPPRGSG